MKKTIWVLMDDRMGSVGQAKGIISALNEDDFEIIEKKIVYNKWAKLPNIIRGSSLIGVEKESIEQLKAPYPDMILSISRRTAPIARFIKKKSPKKTKLIQLMHIGSFGIKDFDVVFVSEHDRGKKASENIVYMTGCPHRINQKTLDEASKKWSETFANLPKPLTCVIVGGAIKGKTFSIENAKDLATQIKEIKQKIGGSILITSSRRTGADAEKAIMKELREIPSYTFLWGEKKENPYIGFLACADNIIVTGDTVSMCSESCGTGKPVMIFSGKDWLTKKHLRFVQSLFDKGYAVAIDNKKAIEFQPSQKLDTAEFLAQNIYKLK